MLDRCDLLLERLRAYGRARVERSDLWRSFDESFPHMRGDPAAQATLRDHLSRLAAAGAIALPRGRSAWDDAQSPPLPRWIRVLSAESDAGATFDPREIAWHPRLEFARDLRGISASERTLLLAVQAALADWPANEPILTIRERSLRLLGDDKLLERMTTGRLFGDGKMSLDLLRCRDARLPFVHEDFGTGEVALIVENKDAWHSACRARARTPCALRWIIYGAGNAILRTVGYFVTLQPTPEQVSYFGDIDARGLRIFVELREKLTGVRLSEWLYARALAHAGDRRCSGEHARDLEDLVAEFSTDLRREVRDVIADGARVPQEWVTEQDYAEWMRTAQR